MSVAATPIPMPRSIQTPPATQVLPAVSDARAWIGYEAALPWLRIAPALPARTQLQAR